MRRWMALAVFIGSAATAAPTYLSCKVQTKKTEVVFNVALDEESSLATVTHTDRGLVERQRATFSQEDVWFATDQVDSARYTISRVDLSVHAEDFNGRSMVRIGEGTCKVREAPQRAF